MMLGSPAGPGGASQRGLWPLAPAPPPSSFTTDGFGRYGVYSLFPGAPSLGGALYSHPSPIGRFASGISPSPGTPFHAATHKESLFSSAGYTFGAPTPPPGSPYSPVAANQLELFAKGFNSNIIIHQPDYPPSPRKRCEEKCYHHQVKSEKPCSCQNSPTLKPKFVEITSGCSRTNPIAWSPPVHVKKEPGATPCQVAEISTSGSPIIKIEVTSPKTHDNTSLTMPSVITSGNIPVGIAVARQRIQHHDMVSSPSLPPAGLLATVNTTTHIKELSRVTEIESTPGMAAGTAGGVTGGGAVLQCSEDRTAGLAGWSVGGSHNSTIATPTLWQYPAALPMEPMVPMPVPVPPVGVQLVRDPTTGHLLLLPTTGIEQVQQAVVWPSYHQPSSLLLPPLPPPPLQLLSSASSDYLSSSTTLHHHTQTHSTRLLALTTTDAKRKLPLPIPTTTFIKIETDAATLDQNKALQAVSAIASNTGTVFTDQNMAPLVTTHVIYQHPTNLILSQPQSEAVCRSQATSPVACLTPPPEVVSGSLPDEENPGVQDASNQTDTPEEDSLTQSHLAEPFQELFEKNPSPHIEEDPLPKPDLSGLELLSNSIVEFENCRKLVEVPTGDGILQRIQHMSIKDREAESAMKVVDDKLGGLDLLCALAEQRIMEESSRNGFKGAPARPHKEKVRDWGREERRREKRKAKRYHDDSRHKKLKTAEQKEKDVIFAEKCSCKETDHRTYKSRESEEEVRKFIASKSQPTYIKDDWPEMNAMELDMRMKLADLQRQYKEKQRELSKLKPKRKSLDEKESKKRKSRKKSTFSEKSATPPPLLDKMDVPIKLNRNVDLLKPPTLCAINGQEPAKTEDLPYSSPESTPEKITSSSKKRKVGRPKKLIQSNDLRIATETIVAKKPKSGTFVEYLLAAKQKLQMQQKGGLVYSSSPPRYVEETTKKIKSHKKNINNNNTIVYSSNSTVSKKTSSKIRPKLKAEPTIKTYAEEEDVINEWEDVDNEEDDSNDEASPIINDEGPEEKEEEELRVAYEGEGGEDADDDDEEDKDKQLTKVIRDSRCILRAEDLDKKDLRVLTAMGGLFYAGYVMALNPPDVYAIMLDGERANRPHIMPREDILRSTFVEICPKDTEELSVGTRLCAYWSQQYRCLYPGSVAAPDSPHPELDKKFVVVEFDDGDSGRIAIEDIRLLPPDHPVIKYDDNPLLSLTRRRRRVSSTTAAEEKKHKVAAAAAQPPTFDEDVPKEKAPEKERTEAAHERKKLKKKKREKMKQKLLAHELKKKKRKHKCCDEHCKHKKHHKKHRKHKKHHHNKNGAEDVVPVEKAEIEAEVPQVDEKPLDEESKDLPEYDIVINPEDEVTMDDILETKPKKSKKIRDRQESCESRSKMTAFLPARQLWSWSGKGYKRPRAKGRSRKQFYKTIQRGKECIMVGDSAVFLSTGRPDRPYIGRIEAMWELCGTMVVKVKWFYHPEETVGCPLNLKYPGALFESPHVDENDVQTISHKCEVLPLKEYREKLGDDPKRYATIYDNNDIYYLAGYYDPSITSLKIESEIPFND